MGHIKINEKSYPFTLMVTPDEISSGMMGKKELDGCMLFKLKKGYHTFHMKNCLVNLDIVFCLNNEIKKIFKDCQADCDEKFIGLGDMVIETLSGVSNDWKIGDKISFNN